MRYDKEKHNFLKYIILIKSTIKAKHDLNEDDLGLICFLFHESYFTEDTFNQAQKILPYRFGRLKWLLKNGLLYVFKDTDSKRTRIYGLSPKAKEIVTDFYKMLLGETPINDFYQRNSVLPNFTPLRAKGYRHNFSLINQEYKLRHRSPL
jgi:hypothetical protein